MLPITNNMTAWEPSQKKVKQETESDNFLFEIMGQLSADSTNNSPFGKEILPLILRNLSPHELIKIGLVCKCWYKAASNTALWTSFNLKEAFPNVTHIDREVWERYIDVNQFMWDLKEEGRPCIDKRDYLEIMRIMSKVENNAKITIMTLFKGQALPTKFADNLKEGNSLGAFINGINELTTQQNLKLFKDFEITKTVTVMITNGVFEESKNKSLEDQKQLAESLKCKAPTLTAVANQAFMQFIISPPEKPITLFDGGTHTLCINKIDDEQISEIPSLFGAASRPTPRAPTKAYYHPQLRTGVHEVNETNGIAGMRELKTIKE